MRRALLLILNTSAPRWFRMRVWIPVLAVLLAGGVFCAQSTNPGDVTSKQTFSSDEGSYGIDTRTSALSTHLGTAFSVRVEWFVSPLAPTLIDRFDQARRRATLDALGPTRVHLLPETPAQWGTSPWSYSTGALIAAIPPIARGLSLWLLLPALLLAVLIAFLRWCQRAWLTTVPNLLARGLCPNCQYALGIGGLLVCPECGAALPGPSPSPTPTTTPPPPGEPRG